MRTPPGQAAGASGSGADGTFASPFSQEREVAVGSKRGRAPGSGGGASGSGAAAAGAGAGAGGRRFALPEGVADVAKMTAAQIKDWLTVTCFAEEEVAALDRRDKRPTKADWVALARTKLG